MSAHAGSAARRDRIVGSMLWSAWADALGFISELTDERGLQRRLHGHRLEAPIEWSRRVGGRYGVTMTLPAGSYSDDTQLRLATARALSSRRFDVEAFAKVEVPIWPSYALGGGRASKAAAANLAKTATPWFANFYEGWTNAGGNGVAMRIQPHVWAADSVASARCLENIIVDAVTTHGHPRAIAGAVLHAAALGMTLAEGTLPPVSAWSDFVGLVEATYQLMENNSQLGSVWLPRWEHEIGSSFQAAWSQTVKEIYWLMKRARPVVKELRRCPDAESAEAAYRRLVDELDLSEPATRGSGTATSVAAMALATALPDRPALVSQIAARALGTDTDTIATMAAALCGAATSGDFPKEVQDADYLVEQALRLADIADGAEVAPFPYPDLLHWSAPTTQLDAVGFDGESLALAGFGHLKPFVDGETKTVRSEAWEWVRVDFGQSLLVKRRIQPRLLTVGNMPVRLPGESSGEVGQQRNGYRKWWTARSQSNADKIGDTKGNAGTLSLSPQADARPVHDEKNQAKKVDVDQMLAWVKSEGYTDRAVAYAIRRVALLGTQEQYESFADGLRRTLRSAAASSSSEVDRKEG
ncbi:ADP-ribosylglycohydrolase family protein [Amycolatopsis alba]|uniref:ADP-ribosylglycohydrolase family protein n=1 Tax=Amycolatopsis alba DSM 44262 TaxID=1125972 RepID=A0A229RBG3_AMYAL|nr:ADP-ribosylglycohydrolase family protein [Amycolatopsis alba]OXM43801.1 hypothetical protein CFP75_37130 [Amycolatopsis alba DSM 44262]